MKEIAPQTRNNSKPTVKRSHREGQVRVSAQINPSRKHERDLADLNTDSTPGRYANGKPHDIDTSEVPVPIYQSAS